jgi:hypothetical protein
VGVFSFTAANNFSDQDAFGTNQFPPHLLLEAGQEMPVIAKPVGFAVRNVTQNNMVGVCDWDD